MNLSIVRKLRSGDYPVTVGHLNSLGIWSVEGSFVTHFACLEVVRTAEGRPVSRVVEKGGRLPDLRPGDELWVYQGDLPTEEDLRLRPLQPACEQIDIFDRSRPYTRRLVLTLT